MPTTTSILYRTTLGERGTLKGLPLTNSEVDGNFSTLAQNKVERTGDTMEGTLTLAPGTTSVAPLKLQTGTNLTTAVAGVIEYDGSLLYFTPTAGNRKTVAYLDSNVASATKLQTARTIQLSGDVAGSASFDGTAAINISTTIQANSIALGTDTTGDYVSGLTSGTGVTVTGATGEGSTPTIAIGQAVATTSDVQFKSIGVGMAASGTTGRIDATNDVVAFSTSDQRLKTNIHNIEEALQKVLQLNGVTFKWNSELKEVHGYEGQDTGVIAQDVEKVLPEVVTTRDNGYKAVKYEKMIGLLIEAIKELNEKVEKCSCNK